MTGSVFERFVITDYTKYDSNGYGTGITIKIPSNYINVKYLAFLSFESRGSSDYTFYAGDITSAYIGNYRGGTNLIIMQSHLTALINPNYEGSSFCLFLAPYTSSENTWYFGVDSSNLPVFPQPIEIRVQLLKLY